MAMGMTFAPGSNEMQQRPMTSQEPLQEAIKLLSLRLPQIVGANSPVPAPLLQSQGGMGADPTGNPLLDLLRRLLGGGQAPQEMGMPSPPLGPGRTGGGVPNPEPGPLPLPQPMPPKPRVILQDPGPAGNPFPAPRRGPFKPGDDSPLGRTNPRPLY